MAWSNREPHDLPILVVRRISGHGLGLLCPECIRRVELAGMADFAT